MTVARPRALPRQHLRLDMGPLSPRTSLMEFVVVALLVAALGIGGGMLATRGAVAVADAIRPVVAR
jgi:hypothetical protein